MDTRCRDETAGMPGDKPPWEELFEARVRLQRQLERERDITARLLRLANASSDLHGFMRAAIAILQEWTGCEAVGIRLRDGDDFPYAETQGFSAEFIRLENSLCATDLAG